MNFILTTLISVLMAVCSPASHQTTNDIPEEIVQWSAELVHVEGDFYNVVLTAEIYDKWSVYSQYLGEGGPIPTLVELEKSDAYKLEGKTQEESDYTVEKMDEMFGMELKKFFKKAVFTQKISSSQDLKSVKGSVEFMTCDDSRCLPPKLVEFTAFRRQ